PKPTVTHDHAHIIVVVVVVVVVRLLSSSSPVYRTVSGLCSLPWYLYLPTPNQTKHQCSKSDHGTGEYRTTVQENTAPRYRRIPYHGTGEHRTTVQENTIPRYSS
ncbi:unnamed protein product, partial [Ectocarpus sp. 12 AP-2014]